MILNRKAPAGQEGKVIAQATAAHLLRQLRRSPRRINSYAICSPETQSQCTMELEPSGTAVKLSITHSIEREPSKFIAAVSGGWPKIISNLKSLLETGSTVL
jgi:hypothetical protein